MGAKKLRIVRDCICGAVNRWIGTPKGDRPFHVFECGTCGVLAQDVKMDRDELAAWYRDKYHAGIYTHSKDHDREVARERIKAYGPKVKGRTLDVGCGSGAFVLELLDKGIEAEGQDLASAACGDWFHQGDLESCNFPTDRYDLVTCHDVLEHVPDPMPFLVECLRCLRPGGWFVLDFPDFNFGPYIVAYFVEHGMYKGWLSQMSVRRIVQELIKIKERGFEVVFMGAGWDVNGLPSMLAGATGAVDLCGETSIDEMFGLINGSSGVVGWPAGNTIMATVLRKETLLFWNSYFDRRFWKLSCPPESRGDWYHWTDTREDPGPAIQAFMERIGTP